MTVTPILQPEPAAPAAARAPRWYPTRAGILNIWRYYDETFEFHNGRLLLRGPNGSGKSKVLELLLPYLLDASLKPNRLSTFGGSERTMHWNLMGDGHTGTTRVGYVWLEFHHPGDEHEPPRWFTCGARLAATANTKNVTPAYFTTSQRIGLPGGLALTRDGGRPLTRALLDEAIGDAGDVHETSDAYRTEVRGTLYGGLNAQRYESLLTALRQLRTPKLSERLDPGLLSELLSSALPPLGEGEIREIAEGFERLDRQRDELKTLDRQVEKARDLAALQRTYARRVLRAGAAGLASADYAVRAAADQVKATSDALDAARAARAKTEEEIGELEDREQRLSSRIDGLKDSDDYRAGKDLAEMRAAKSDAEGTARASRKAAGERSTSAKKKQKELADATQALAQRRELRERAAADAERAATRADMPWAYDEVTTRIAVATAESIHEARQLLRAAVESRAGQITEVRTALADHGTAVNARAAAERDRDDSREKHDAAIVERDEAREAHAEAVDALAQELRSWAGTCRELAPLDGDALAEHAGTKGLVDDLVVAAQTRSAERIATAKSEVRNRRDVLTGERDERQAERTKLDHKVDLPPHPPRTRHSDRDARPGSPFWRLVAFGDGIDASAQAGIEGALEASGLLDAWVMPDGAIMSAEQDTFIAGPLTRPATGRSLADVLTIEPGALVPPELVRGLLSAIAYGRGDAAGLGHPVAVAADGTWRLAAATGLCTKPEPEYIGAVARERSRQRRIARLDAEIADLEREITENEAALSDLDRRRTDLDAELARRPKHAPVQKAYQAWEKAEQEITHRSENLDRDEKRLQERETDVAAALRTLTTLAAEHGLPSDAPELDTVAAAVRTVGETGETWLGHCEKVGAAEEHTADLQGTAEEFAALAHAAEQQALDDETKATGLAEKLAAIEETVGAKHQNVLDLLRQAEDELKACGPALKERRTRLTTVSVDVGKLESAAGTARTQQQEADATRNQAAERFRHLILGHLPADAQIETSLSADGIKAALEAARAVSAALDRVPHEPRNLRDAETRLTEEMHRSRDVLADRADLELVPDDDIKVFTATMDGVHVGAAGLHESLREERTQRQADITDKEHALFEQTLAGDTRRHLADRIRQANGLVEDMNRRLERVRTASRVAVRLVWQVDPQQSAGTRAARDLLLKDPAQLSDANRQALYRFFRERVEEAQAANTAASWEEQLMQVLDYTKWHRFTVRLNREDGNGWQDLTKRMHGALSGGEKAIALHLPLFAAVSAHYQTDPGAPRFILLDEVFVGVDTSNRGQVFDLLVDLDLDLVLTSDHEWCDYRELDGIAVHQLITGTDGDDDNAVTTARFVWNGHRIIAADDPADAGDPRPRTE